MALKEIYVDDLDTEISGAVGIDPDTKLAIDISGATKVYFDVYKPVSAAWVEWVGTVDPDDNNVILYNMVAADYEIGIYKIHTRVIFTTDVRQFRGNKYTIRVLKRGN